MASRSVILLALCAAVAQLVFLPLLTEADDDLARGTLNKDVALLKTQMNEVRTTLDKLSKAPSPGNTGLTFLKDGRVLVFRMTAGTGKSGYDRYVSVGSNDDSSFIGCGCRTLNASLPCFAHYRSSVLNEWPSGLVDTVRVSVIAADKEVAFLEFNGRGSTYKDWFSVDRLLNSTWKDIKTESRNFFSIDGDAGRRFFISRNYGGCPVDQSWLVVTEGKDVCTWGQGTTSPIILYSKLQTYGNPNTAGHFGRADALAVTIKMRDDLKWNTC